MKTASLTTQIFRFIFLILLLNLIGYISAQYMTQDTMAWYHTLPLSSLNPPDYIFGIIWGILFLMQAVAALLVWGKVSPRSFALQLALNMLWSFVFFYLRRPDYALIVVCLFIVALIMNIRTFGHANKWAGWLIVPTLCWAIFALYLNSVIVF